MQRGRRYLYDPLDDELTVGASLSSSDSDLGLPVYNSTAIADSEDPSDLSGSDDVDDQNGTDSSDKVTGPRVVTRCTSIARPVDTSDDEKWIVEDFVRNLIEGGEQDFEDSSDADSDATDMGLDARLAKMGGKLRDRLVPLSDFNDLLDDYGDMSLSDLDEDMEVLPTLTRRQRRRLMNREASRGKVRTAASEPLKPPPVDSADSGEQRRRLTKAEVGMLTSHFSAKSRFARAKREMGLPMAPDRKGKMAPSATSPSSQQRNAPPTSRLERKEYRKLLRQQQKDKSKRQPKPPGPPVQGGSGRRKTLALSDTSPTVFVAASSTLAADLTVTSAPAITTMTAMRREDMAFGHVRAIGSTNPGHRLLAKMGWQPGQGIGISRQGITDPIQVQIRKTRRGLGHGENPVHDK
ncbi:squalene synthetase-like protein [Tieghemiomyces parasiticus]|uniref:Squalene synthetase-like protein n=1 Tax=Tieghemiomyces parasiticus TaxID=78921 RepID=A0A9W7ZMU0_9FUNG|nr:squalene synthetase-like protein [Tieghemiomyces parasiticus]